jgi:CDGSH-type Zn-finger protein
MCQVGIKALKNGPLEVAAAVELTDSNGAPLPTTENPLYLCRCGHSANKPFCDGSHKKVGFQG